eukprot:scaffold147642_cov96-Cyclotella_meneghiniana.AAC.2
MTLWGKVTAYQQIQHERYLPPNTKHIIDASIHSNSGVCAILAQPLEDDTPSHYILSLVSLPNAPPGIMRRKDSSNEYKLLWQRHISWDLFSSSDTYPIVSFSTQGTHILFGSTERFGVVGIENGCRIFQPMTNYCSSIKAYLFLHEFLFILDKDGKRLRVYDVSNTNTATALAEGDIPWSITLSEKHKKSSGLVRLHHSHEQHRQQLREEYQLAFCGGKIWITGFFHFDLVCSSPRLLRKLRSQISSSEKIMSLQFTRMKADLQLSAPKPMHVWNDSHLYVVDSTKVYCWKTPKANSSRENELTTLLSGNDFIESIHCDGQKMIVASNCTFRNTSIREWDGSGSITVIPIDSYEPFDTTLQIISSTSSTVPSSKHRRSDKPSLDLMYPSQYSPLLQLFNKRFFKHHTFTGR